VCRQRVGLQPAHCLDERGESKFGGGARGTSSARVIVAESSAHGRGGRPDRVATVASEFLEFHAFGLATIAAACE
jgi:hypothetical protein